MQSMQMRQDDPTTAKASKAAMGKFPLAPFPAEALHKARQALALHDPRSVNPARG